MDNIYRIAAATARSNSTPLPIAQPPTRRRPPQQPLKPPTDRHARQSALPESIRRPSQQPSPSPTDRHTPTAMHPRIPSTPISRKLSSSLVKRSCERTCANVAPPIPKIPKNPANPASDNPPNARQTLVISRQTLTRAPLRQRRPSHPENPQKSCKSCFRQSPQRLVKLSSSLVKRSHASAPVPTSPLPSRKSPRILQILLQTIPPISRKLSSSLVKRSCGRTCANVAPPIPKIPKKSCKSSFRQFAQRS